MLVTSARAATGAGAVVAEIERDGIEQVAEDARQGDEHHAAAVEGDAGCSARWARTRALSDGRRRLGEPGAAEGLWSGSPVGRKSPSRKE